MARKSYDRTRFRAGFTLIELLVTTLILAMASSVIMVSFREPIERARFEAFCHKLIDLDGRARRAAGAANRPVLVRFDLDDQQIAVSRWNQGALFWQTHRVPRRIRIESVLQIDDKRSDGIASFTVSINGTTPSYAIEVSHGNQRKWIAFIGGSGQSSESEDEIEIQSMFELFRQIGADAR